jgi:hypothetical protein
MTQLQMFDPRLAPTATAVMLEDAKLRLAIDSMREGEDGGWPYVEQLCEIDRRPAWLVEDDGQRYVVVNGFIWQPDELDMAAPKMRDAARAAMARLDEIGQQGEAA